MGAVTRPTFQDVVVRFGLQTYFDLVSDDLTDVGEDLVSDAEAETAQIVGEARYDGTAWTSRQARGLARAISCRCAAKTLENPRIRKVLGTQEPLVAEAAEQVALIIDSLMAEAERLEALTLTGSDAAPPFSLPAFASGTFSPSTTDRTPLERDLLFDERDDISDQDLTNG